MNWADILFRYPSINDPRVLAAAIAAMAALTMTIVMRPQWFVPLLLIAAPIPKLAGIGVHEETIGVDRYTVVARPGFSIVELVVAGGLLATLLMRPRQNRRPETRLGRAIWLAMASAAVSMAVGLAVDPERYRGSDLLYGVRFVATIGCFFLARRYANRMGALGALRGALRTILISGNVVLALGLVYYFAIGSVITPAQSDVIVHTAGAGIWRHYLFFFDYSYEFGFYLALLALLNVALLLRARSQVVRFCGFLGALGCVYSTLLLGQRGNILIVAVPAVVFAHYLNQECVGGAAMSRRITQIGLALGFAMISVAAFQYFAPSEAIQAKLRGSYGVDNRGLAADTGVKLGLPEEVASWLGELPIGDFSYRLTLAVASLWFFLRHPWGVGFSGEVHVAGWFAHHELARVAVEQGVLGLLCFGVLALELWRLARTRAVCRERDRLDVLIVRALTAGFLVASLCALTAMFLVKFAFIFWALLGICDALLSASREAAAPAPEPRPRATGGVAA